jgi:hypothetical protein
MGWLCERADERGGGRIKIFCRILYETKDNVAIKRDPHNSVHHLLHETHEMNA